jgi:hypothetical protein
MAPAVHGSDSDGTNSESSPRKSKSQVGSPEQPGQSDQPGPADSDEDSEVYEIEAILDAKRGATGSVRFYVHSLKQRDLLFPYQDQNRLPRQVEKLSGRGE